MSALAVTTGIALAATLCRDESRLAAVRAEVTDRSIDDGQWQLLHVAFVLFVIGFGCSVFTLAQVFAQDLGNGIRQRAGPG